MIEFKREGTKVVITVESGVMNYEFSFNHECNHDHFAVLMRDAYNKHMNEELRKVREQAYNKGWKDAKAKVKKETWFSGRW